jgi:hypothetical protein
MIRQTFCIGVLLLMSPLPAAAQVASHEVDPNTGSALACTGIGEPEFLQMAEELITRVLSDEAFMSLTENERPRVQIGDLLNNSHSYRLETDSMFRAFRNILVRSQAVRLFAPDAEPPADLTLSARLSSTYLSRDDAQEAAFTLNVSLTTISGE